METLPLALAALEDIDRRVLVAPETSGAHAQFGSLDEILALCAAHPRLVPCLDFAHIHARLNGYLFDAGAFDAVFRRVEQTLGREKLERAHIHYYPVEYGPRGERCHHAFEEPDYGPRPEPFVAALRRWGLSPTVICESRDRQDVDALLMKRMYGN
jgi:deoxyribonuclease-4